MHLAAAMLATATIFAPITHLFGLPCMDTPMQTPDVIARSLIIGTTQFPPEVRVLTLPMQPGTGPLTIRLRHLPPACGEYMIRCQ